MDGPLSVRSSALCMCGSLGRFTQSSLKRDVEIATHFRHALIAILAKERGRFVIFKNALPCSSSNRTTRSGA